MAELMTKTRIPGEAPQTANVLRVCFVCTGNTCRSPMAEAITNASVGDEPEKERDSVGGQTHTRRVTAKSRGLFASDGEPISANAVRALELAGIRPGEGTDYHSHTARTLRAEELNEFDWLIAMSDRHAMELLLRFPEAAPKIVCMPVPIADPWGGDLSCYRECLAAITEGVKQLLFTEESI